MDRKLNLAFEDNNIKFNKHYKELNKEKIMKKFNKDCYVNELMFNLQCDEKRYLLQITEGLFANCEERAYCEFTEEEILTLINFLNELKNTYIKEEKND